MDTKMRALLATVAIAVLLQPVQASDRVEAGNGAYLVLMNAPDGSPFGNGSAGFNAAWTGPEHPVTAWGGRPAEVIAARPDCPTCTGLSDLVATTVRSYTSRTDYTLGNNLYVHLFSEATPGFGCFNANDIRVPRVEQALDGGVATGVQSTWEIHQGGDDLRVTELIRARGHDFMDGAVELTLSVVNLGTASQRLGVRRGWVLRINGQPTTSNPYNLGVETWYLGVRPPDPASEPYASVETEWSDPTTRAWEAAAGTPTPSRGHPLYLIGGTVTGPSTLMPPPTPPSLVEAGMAGGLAGLGYPGGGAFDRCFEWRVPDPPRDLLHAIGGRAALLTYWGHDEDHAIEVPPGGEARFTQYLVAYLDYPLGATTTGPYVAPCTGSATRVPISGEAVLAQPTAGTVVTRWSSSDSRVSFDDPHAPDTVAHVAGVGTFPLRLTVTIGAYEASADTTLEVQDVDSPRITELVASPSSLWPPNHRLVPVHVTASVEDDCDPSPTLRLVGVRSRDVGLTLIPLGPGRPHDPDWSDADIGTDDRDVLLRAERAGDGGGRIYTLEYEAVDASGNTARRSVEVTVAHDQRRNLAPPFSRR